MDPDHHHQFPPELISEAYETLKSDDNALMETLFSQLHSPDHRSRAVTFLQCCKRHHPDTLFIKLFFLLIYSPDPATRANAARTLQFLDPAHLWQKLRPQAQTNLKAQFLNFMAQESSLSVLRPTVPLLAETVTVFHNNNHQWPEILDFLISSLALNNDTRREVGLSILAYLQNDSRLTLTESLHNRHGAVRTLLSSLLSSLNSPSNDIKILSFRAAVNFVGLFSEPSLFHDLLRAMMVGVFSLLNGFERSYFRSAFVELASLVAREPVLLRPYMSDMVLDALQIAESSVAPATRRLVIGMVVAIAGVDVKDFDPVLPGLPHQTVVRLFVVLMRMVVVCAVEEDGGELLGEEGASEFGIKGLEKICAAVGGSRAVAVVHEMLPLFLDAAEWKERHAGITILGVIAKVISDEMVMKENFVEEVVTRVLNSFQDSQVQVRLAALNLMQMPSNFVQVVQLLYHQRIILAFSIALGNEQDQKVKEEAASAMLFFLKNTLPTSLTLYNNVDTVMGNLLSLIQGKENEKLRSIALSTFNIVAQKCHEVANKYYGVYLPLLLEACTDKSSEIKEEAVRGIRICAEFGTPQLKPFINRIISELSMLINDPNPPLPENAKAREIAVSAIGRICHFHRDCIEGSKIVPAWLSFLPLKDDLSEAKLMHEQLCAMVERLDNDLLGAGFQNLVKIVTVFLEVIQEGDKLATSETINQMNNVLRQLALQIPRSALDAIILSLNAQQRELLLPLVSFQ